MEPLQPGSIVLALRGRDQGNVYAVIDCDYDPALPRPCVTIADGKTHRVACPKRKNPIHLQTIHACDEAIADAIDCGTLTDKLLANALKAYSTKE